MSKIPPPGKARDHAPGDEKYTGRAQKTLYREGYQAGLAGADAGHNPHKGATARTIWEAGRKRGRQDRPDEAPNGDNDNEVNDR